MAPQEKPVPVLVDHPILVVGVPVFNEARYLREALQTLESQNWPDFAVLIADNDSSDGSDSIAREFCERDPRFRLHRHESNIGALANFKFLRDATRSPLFMWLGAHDVVEPDYLTEAVAAHHADPSISVTYSWMRMIGVDGSVECVLKNDKAALMSRAPMRRYLHAYRYVCGWEGSHVLRRSAFDDFEFRETITWDLILLAHLAFKGPFKCIPKHLYSLRNVHPRVPGSEQTTMERLTGEKGRTGDVEKTLRHALDDFTSLAHGRLGWTIYRSLLRAVIIHRAQPGGLGLFSALLRVTASVRNPFGGPYHKPADGV